MSDNLPVSGYLKIERLAKHAVWLIFNTWQKTELDATTPMAYVETCALRRNAYLYQAD